MRRQHFNAQSNTQWAAYNKKLCWAKPKLTYLLSNPMLIGIIESVFLRPAMPIYAYKCSACGHAKDVLQKISDDPLTVCPACGAAEFAKQITAAGFQLKGAGWYVTDFRSGGDGANSGVGKSAETASTEASAPAAAPAPAVASTPAPAPVSAPAPSPKVAPAASNATKSIATKSINTGAKA